MSNIKVLTLNTHSWLEKEPLVKLEQIAQQIVKGEYDLVALQEVNQLLNSETIKTDHYFNTTKEQTAIHEDNFAYQLVKRLKELGQPYYWSWTYNHIGYDRFQEGNALLAKTPLTSQAVLVSDCDDPSDYHTRKILVAETTVKEQTVLVASCHFSWWQEQGGFLVEWQRLVDHLVNQNAPMILLGDFNNPAQEKAKGYDLVLKSPLALQDSYLVAKEKTGEMTVVKAIDGWKESTEQLRIDFIFSSLVFDVQTINVVFDDQNGPIVSDHFGVEASLKLTR